MRRLVVVLLAACASLAATATVSAQLLRDPLRSENEFETETGIVGRFEEPGGIVLNPVTISAQIAPASGERPAVLIIHAKVAEGRHTYSLTQAAGGPTPSKIVLERSPDFRQLAPFQSDPPPHVRTEKGPIWTGLEIQEHEGQFTWYAPIELTAGIDSSVLAIRGTVEMEVCQTGGYCEPVEKTFTAKVADNAKLPPAIGEALRQFENRSAPAAIGEYQPKNSAVKFSGRLVPKSVQPGESAQLEITATLPEGSRIYAHADRDDRLGTKPLLIALERTSGLVPQRATTNASVKTDNSVPQFGPMRYHEGSATWTVKVDVPAKAAPGEYVIRGLLGYQSCEYHDDGKNVCELPQAVQFQATLIVGDSSADSAPLSFGPGGNYLQVAAAAATFADFLGVEAPTEVTSTVVEPPRQDVPVLAAADQYDLNRIELDASHGSLTYYIALAFVGGLILNLMPCVLPVIGLKVMSFVEQAHRSRSHALMLNVWFAFGIISVFLLLGLLAVIFGLSWGGQFGSTPFNVTIAAVVFAMALSLLGVWEVPIPGFFGSGSIQKAAAQEGPLGAFLKGVVTTVLATPCTAPFMAAAVAWAVAQPMAKTLVVFTTLGLGMASPYLLVGVFPELLRFLPKPGAWMETFKQVSGFVLLATVVFVLSFIDAAAVVPTVALLLGVAVACWLISRTPLAAEFRDRLQTWALAGAVILLFAVFSFGWLYGIASGPAAQTAWQPFSLERLKQVAVDEGRTVLVDFSAEWCLNCKFFEHTVLHTEPVEKAIARSGAVTMYADFTKYPPEIDRTIKALKSNGVPVIAVFPGDAPYNPIVFRGSYSQQDLVAALEKATGRRLRGGSSVAEASTISPPLN